MCGIIGFVSKETKNANVLIDGLKALEYRGYDSCGIAIVNDNRMTLCKAEGKVKNLEAKITANLVGTCGIAHTRWATHGEPSELNAHPHQVHNVTLVHNGIIENCERLKKELISQGMVFKTQTDTEIACAVFDNLLRQTRDKLEIIHQASSLLEGSYAFAIIFNDELDTIYTIHQNSPLMLGSSEDSYYLASDAMAFLPFTNMIIDLKENEIAKINDSGISIYDEEMKIIDRKPYRSTVTLQETQKLNYDTFLLKEIYEEPASVYKTIHHYLNKNLFDLYKTMPDLRKYDRFIFVGCGSAMHAGYIAKDLMEKYARVIASIEIASEFRYSSPIINDKTMCVFISQSGETADTLAALRMIKNRGIDTLAIVNVIDSSLAKEAKYTLYTLAGKEISVATTKAYVAQLCVLALLVIKKSIQDNKLALIDELEIEKELKYLPAIIKNYLSYVNVDNFKRALNNKDHVFFIGRGIDYAISLEGSLKLKEVSYIHSEAYAAGELKHGAISLIEKGTPVIACITDSELKDKTLSNIKEVQARGACVLLLIREDLYNDSINADEIILIPEIHKIFQPVVTIIVYQLLAYQIAKDLNRDIDHPRNLAKSVTVE